MKVLILIFCFYAVCAHGQSLDVDATMFPAGSFTASTKDVTGHATIKGDLVEAKEVTISLLNLKTGNPTRDQHAQKYLETKTYPDAKLLKAVGKNGKGKAKIVFRGQEETVDGTYVLSKDKKSLTATFPLLLSTFKITGVRYLGVGVKDQVIVRIQIPVK